HLVAVTRVEQGPRALERLPDRVRPGVRVAVGVAADPRAEPQRRRRPRKAVAVVREQALGGVHEAQLEEPVPAADLVGDARTARTDLVRLPEQRDLGRERPLDITLL